MIRLITYIFLITFIGCSTPVPQQATTISLDDLKQLLNPDNNNNHIQIINFWATWCAPCVDELPEFEQIQNTYNKQVSVTLVSLDDPTTIATQVNPFITTHQLQSTVVVLDHPYAADYIPLVDKHWDGAIPATIIIYNDRQLFYNQQLTYDQLEQAIVTIKQ